MYSASCANFSAALMCKESVGEKLMASHYEGNGASRNTIF
jgi:hypothetical protein